MAFPGGVRRLLAELKRRRVVRTAATYAVVAWLLIQFADTVFPALNLPAWTVTATVVLLLIGFPITLALSWAFRLERESDAGDADAEGPTPSAAAAPARVRIEVVHPAIVALVALAVVTVAAWALVRMRRPSLGAFPARGWAILARTENYTGDSVFSGSLDAALGVALEQSAYVNLASAPQIDDALRRMRRPPGSSVDATTAREIAQRSGLDVVLAPSIAGINERYVIAVRVEDPATGRNYRTLATRAEGRAEILPAVTRLAQQVRTYLGESSAALERHNAPLEQATTSSLQALKLFSLGFDAQRRGRYGEAKQFYERALREDSSFARALTSLGMLEYEMGRRAQAGDVAFRDFDVERGRRLLERAALYVDSVSERERYAIMLAHALAVEGDVDGAIRIEQARLAEYPDNYVSHNNLGRLYEYKHQWADAVAEYKRALRVFPGLTGAYDGVVFSQLYHLGQLDSGLVWAKREVARDSTYYRGYDMLGWAYVGRDSLGRAAHAFARATALKPDYTISRARLGHTYRLLGRYDSAIAAFQEILRRDSTDTSADYDIAAVYHLTGDTAAERSHLERRLRDERRQLARDSSPANQFTLADVLTRLGRTDEAAAVARRGVARLATEPTPDPATAALRAGLGLDPYGYFELATLRSLQGRRADAVAALQEAMDHGYSNIVWLLLHPDFQALRGDSAFRGLVGRALHIRP